MPGRSRARSSSRAADPARAASSPASLEAGAVDFRPAANLDEETPTLDAASRLEAGEELGPDDVPPPEIVSENATETEDVSPDSDPAPESVSEEVTDESPAMDEKEEVEEPDAALSDASDLANGAPPAEPPPDPEIPSDMGVDVTANLGVPELEIAAPRNDGPEVREAFVAEVGATPEQVANNGQAVLDSLQTSAATMQGTVGDSKKPIADRIKKAADAQAKRVSAAEESIKKDVQKAFEEARKFSLERYNQTIGDIDGHLATAIGNIDGAERSAIELLDQEMERVAGDLETVVTEGDAKLKKTITDAATAVEGIGRDRGADAIQIGNDKAGGFSGRQTSDKLERERNTARAKAARETAEGYRDSFVERAGLTANELREAAANMGEAVCEASATVAGELGTLKATGKKEIENQAETARKQARTNAAAAKQAALDMWIGFDLQLDDQEKAALKAHGDAAEKLRGEILAAGTEATKDILDAVQKGIDWFDLTLTAVKEIVDGFDDADDAALADFAEGVLEILAEGERDQLQKGDEAAQLFETDVAKMATDGIGGLRESADKIAVEVGKARDTHGKAHDKLTEDFARETANYAAGVAEGLDNLAKDTGRIGDDYVSTFKQSIEDQITSIDTEMGTVKTGMENQFGEALGKLPGEIDTKAEEAARKIQPWWKRALATVVSVVVAVVVFVAVAAFCVLTLGTGLVVAGLIAGGISAVAALFAKDLVNIATGVQDGFSKPKEYLAAAITGAVGGAIGGFTVGMAPIATAVYTGLASGVADAFTQVVVLGNDFSLGRTLLMAGISALTAGLASKYLSTPSLERVTGSNRSWNNFRGGFQPARNMEPARGFDHLLWDVGVVAEYAVDQAAGQAVGGVTGFVEGEIDEAQKREKARNTPTEVNVGLPEERPTANPTAPTFDESQLDAVRRAPSMVAPEESGAVNS